MPSSGQIAFGAIRTEYQVSGELNLQDLYGRSRGLPTSGEITANDFYTETAFVYITLGSGGSPGTMYGYSVGDGGLAAFGSIAGGGPVDPWVMNAPNGNFLVHVIGYWTVTGGMILRARKSGGVWSDADSTFRQLEINGSTLNRSAASTSQNSTWFQWSWASSGNLFGTTSAGTTHDMALLM